MSGPGYSVTSAGDGGFIQAGVWSDDGEAGWDRTAGWIARAVVLKVYFPEDATWKDRGWGNETKAKPMACDVRVYGGLNRTLQMVPMVQNVAGLFDEDIYIPRESKGTTDGSNLVSEFSTKGSPITPAQIANGDHVLVGFLEGDPHKPFIFPFMFPHPSSTPRITDADGRIRRIRHNGTLVEWDKEGNLTLDASGAAQDELGPKGTEILSSTGGNVRIKTADGSREFKVESDNIRLDGGNVELSDSPTQAVIKGDDHKELMDAVLDALSTWAGTVLQPVPNPTTAPLVSAITAYTASSGYLSSKVKTG